MKSFILGTITQLLHKKPITLNRMRKIPELDYSGRFIFDEVSSVDDSDVFTNILKYSTINYVKYIHDINFKGFMWFNNVEPMMDAYFEYQVAFSNVIV